ncbi:hypothetical protein FQR65_LT07564 [Abscondita terminalis]|nr:hypothetical protein FQR65_LT07564 [Abscondita terminalis]
MVFQDRLYQYILFCACSFTSLQSGLNDGWSSFALPLLISTIPLTKDESSWLVSVYPIGSVVGSTIFMLLADVFGRRTILLMGTLPLCGTWLWIAFARSTWELDVARFTAGFLDGFTTLCGVLYLAEVSDPKIRGLLITGCKMFYIAGLFVTNLLGAFLTVFQAAIISSAVSLSVFLYLLVPESPYFHMIKNEDNKAKVNMKIFNKNADVDVIRNALNEQKSKDGKWFELFTEANNRKSLYLIIVMKIFQQFSGIAIFVYYAQTVFSQSKDDVNPIIFVSIYYTLQITVMIINGLIVDKIGRKPLLLTSMCTVVVALLIVSTYFVLKNVTTIDVSEYSWCPVVGLFLYIVGYSLGLQNVPYIIVSEIFPLHVKSVASGIFCLVYGICAVVASKLFQYTTDKFGMHVPFIIFTISSICSIPFFALFVPETKKKTLEKIERDIRLKETSNVN